MLGRDVRYAVRQLRKSPGFAATAILTLAFGIGATTAIFSIVEGVLLRPLPFTDPSRLVLVGDLIEGTSFDNPDVPAYESILYARGTHAFSSMGAFQQTNYELSGAGDPSQVNAARLNAGVFTALSVSPLMGRVFTTQEDEGRQQVAVISYQTWRSRFHGNPQVLGTTIQLDRKSYTVVGVMPRDFEFPLVPGQLNRSELWVPMSFTQGELENGKASWNFGMVARLKPGISPAQGQQDAELVAQQIQRALPPEIASSLRIHAAVRRLDEFTVQAARPLVRALFLAVAVVLFIACANLAGLLLVRVIRRRREISVRLALGANANAIVRQGLVETLALSVTGGLLGLGLAAIALPAGMSFLPETLPRISSISLDWAVVGFALLLAVLTGLVCGLVPALAATRTDVNETLKEGGRTGTTGSGHARLRSVLVVAELAVALVLLTGAGLLLRSFEKLRAVDLGFRTDHVLTGSYSLPQHQYSTQTAVDAFNRLLLEKLAQLPSVQAVGLTSALPAAGSENNTGIYAEGYNPPQGGELQLAWPSQILGDYLKAEGIPLIRGRAFTEADRADSPVVVIVNHALAEHFWPGQDPIGKRIHIGVKATPLPWMTVVGEIGDIKQTTADGETQPQIYQPVSQFKLALGQFAAPDMLVGNGGSIVMRSAMAPEQMADSLRAAVRSIDPQLPLTQIESMDKVVAEGQAPRRFNAALISSFAVAAVLLAILGIYSVIAFSAALRTQEMAIRMALGSQRSSVMKLILVSGAKLGLAGCVIGGVGAVFATRLLRSLLFQVDPLDVPVLVIAVISIFALAVLASLLPARRAASVDPMQALRME
ncbi:MAG TPA: ABC transporter permease [Candidatus Sulfopaludibacter sp.]|nr:ABC transporter permease [Candidatus Sulfopaludibacter sp.]